MTFEDDYKKAIEEAEKLIEQEGGKQKKRRKAKSVEDQERPEGYEGDASEILWCELMKHIHEIRVKTDMFGHIIW